MRERIQFPYTDYPISLGAFQEDYSECARKFPPSNPATAPMFQACLAQSKNALSRSVSRDQTKSDVAIYYLTSTTFGVPNWVLLAGIGILGYVYLASGRRS